MQKAESYIDQQLEKASCKASDGASAAEGLQ